MPSLPSVVPGDLFAFPYFAGKIPGPVARLMAQSLRSELSPSHFVTAPWGHAVTPFGRSGRPFRLSIFCGQNTRPGRAPDGAVASLRIIPSHFVTAPGGMPSLPSVVPGDLSVFYGQNTRISRESRLLNILNRRIFLQRNTYLSVKVALFPDGMLKLVGLSGEMADFPDESHNLR